MFSFFGCLLWITSEKASGVSYRDPLSARMYFYEQQDVDQYMSNYPKSTKESTRSKVMIYHWFADSAANNMSIYE